MVINNKFRALCAVFLLFFTLSHTPQLTASMRSDQAQQAPQKSFFSKENMLLFVGGVGLAASYYYSGDIANMIQQAPLELKTMSVGTGIACFGKASYWLWKKMRQLCRRTPYEPQELEQAQETRASICSCGCNKLINDFDYVSFIFEEKDLNLFHTDCLKSLINQRKFKPKNKILFYKFAEFKEKQISAKPLGILWPFCAHHGCKTPFMYDQLTEFVVALPDNVYCHQACFPALLERNPEVKRSHQQFYSYKLRNLLDQEKDIKDIIETQVWPGCVRCEGEIKKESSGYLLNIKDRNCRCNAVRFCHAGCASRQNSMNKLFNCKHCKCPIEGHIYKVEKMGDLQNLIKNYDSEDEHEMKQIYTPARYSVESNYPRLDRNLEDSWAAHSSPYYPESEVSSHATSPDAASYPSRQQIEEKEQSQQSQCLTINNTITNNYFTDPRIGFVVIQQQQQINDLQRKLIFKKLQDQDSILKKQQTILEAIQLKLETYTEEHRLVNFFEQLKKLHQAIRSIRQPIIVTQNNQLTFETINQQQHKINLRHIFLLKQQNFLRAQIYS